MLVRTTIYTTKGKYKLLSYWHSKYGYFLRIGRLILHFQMYKEGA